LHCYNVDGWSTGVVECWSHGLKTNTPTHPISLTACEILLSSMQSEFRGKL
jgi:hypothetical protein